MFCLMRRVCACVTQGVLLIDNHSCLCAGRTMEQKQPSYRELRHFVYQTFAVRGYGPSVEEFMLTYNKTSRSGALALLDLLEENRGVVRMGRENILMAFP